MRKPALVVDDSRVAAVALRRLLERQGLPVDIAESGIEALDYLRSNVLPRVVFLDYMMPGMDGFEALAAIKADARLAAIPIVMYTSQEGEGYAGQALARGAYDVLRKPLRAAELRRILQRLDVRPEPMPEAGGVAEPGRVAVAVAPDALGAALPGRTHERHAEAPAPPVPAAAASVSVAPDERTAAPPEAAEGGLGWRPWVLGALFVAALGLWYFAPERPHPEVPARPPPAVQQHAPAAAPVPTPDPDVGQLVDVISWALNLQNEYAYHQLPLDDQRLALVRELVSRLAQAGFRGVVRLDTHVGEFCLARDGFGGFRLPEAASRISECEVIEHTAQEAAALGRRQSPAFMRYLASQLPGRDQIKIEIVSHGGDRPLIAYPNYATTQTAGEWNAVAQRNNRVQIFIVPARSN